MVTCDILIIGAGAAGIAAARAAAEAGCQQILLVDRKKEPGGILQQCFHRGFGRNVSGPEYVRELLLDFPEFVIWQPGTTVLSVGADKTARLSSTQFGRQTVAFRQLILATGCREVPLGALPIGGTRPRGIYTAGQMQEMMNLHGHVPEGPAVILGSGDIGLVMAGHLADREIPVALVEQRERCGGMEKNQVCLGNPFVRLLCASTIREVHGRKQLEGVTLSHGEFLPCKTLLIAAGLRPDRELIRGLEDCDWIHSCGNCSTVHPIVESVVTEGEQAGIAAYEKIRGNL